MSADQMRKLMETIQRNEGYEVRTPIDHDEYPNREHQGLEGPFSMKNGQVLYYDPAEGKYYNSRTDIYVSYDEYTAMNSDNPLDDVEIEEGSQDSPYDRKTLEMDRRGGISLYGWSTYSPMSVLAGQAKKVFLAGYDSKEEAEAENPGATWSNKYMEPQVSTGHLNPDGDFGGQDGYGEFDEDSTDGHEVDPELIYELEEIANTMLDLINNFESILRSAAGRNRQLSDRFDAYPGGHIKSALGEGNPYDTSLFDIIKDLKEMNEFDPEMEESLVEADVNPAKQIAQACARVWQIIAYDIHEDSVPAIDVVELCTDADRLSQNGFEEEEKLFFDLIKNLDSVDEALRAVAAQLPYEEYEAGGAQGTGFEYR